jgi:ABC-2 type transport system ATP-binding protein
VGVIAKGRVVAEGTIDELRGGTRLVVRAQPVEIAQRVLAGEAGEANVSTVDGAFNVKIELARAPVLNRRLVEAGVDVSELRAGERSLEEVFMELTGTEAGL